MVSQRLRVPASGGTVLFSPETSAPARSPGSAAPGTEAPGTGPLLGTPEMDHAVVERRFGGHMSVEPRKLMSEGWTSWQGHVQPSDRKSTRLNSSHRCISYAVFCLKKKS